MKTRPTLIALAIGAAFAALPATPALAGGAVTDLSIGKYLPPPDDLVIGSVGNDIHNNDLASQSKTVMVKPGKTARFAILLENDGTPGTMNCAASSFPQSAKFKATIRSNGLNVTSQWTGATYSTPLDAAEGVWHYLNVRVAKTAKPGSTRLYDFSCAAAVDLTTDVARAQLTVK